MYADRAPSHPSPRALRPASRLVPSFLAVSVLAVLVSLSVVAFWVMHRGVDRQDRELLREQTSHVVLIHQQYLEGISSLLGSVGVGAKVFDANAAQLRAAHPADTTVIQVTEGRADPHSGDVTPGRPRVDIVVGPGLGLHPGQVLTGELARIAVAAPRDQTLAASPVINVAGRPSVVFSIVPPAIGLPGYVALEVARVYPARASHTNGPYSKLDVALYAAPSPKAADLVASNTRGMAPLPKPWEVDALTVGHVRWTAVGAAGSPLLDDGAQIAPWIVLGVGLLLALGMAITVETLVRRQREQRIVAEKQRTVAEALQEALLPETLPQMGNTQTAVRYLPGVEEIHVGGDWYDLIAVDDTHLLAVVGDVSGKGLEAATLMARLQHATQAYAAEGYAPEVILSKLSALMSMKHSGHFATALLIVIDLERQNITVVNGGHPPPLVIREHQSEYVHAQVGPPVGVSSTPTYTPITVPLSPGTTLLAFTDGLIERRGESWDVGLGRLRQAATANEEGSLEGLLSSLVESMIGKGAADDTVLLALRVPGTPDVDRAPDAEPDVPLLATGRTLP